MAQPLACPRCDAVETEKMADSPVAGKWEVYRCSKCNYLWRNTENLQGAAKLTKDMIDQAVHTVP